MKGLTNLETIWLNNNQLQHLHRDLFKDNLKLKIIVLHENKLKSLHPQMFSQLSLNTLRLANNTCVSKEFWSGTSKATIEKELWGCGYWYLLQGNNCQSKLELLTKLVDRNEENAMELRKFVNDW